MARLPRKVLGEHRARERLEHRLQLLELEVRLRSPRRHLEVLIELCEMLAERLGPPTLETDALTRRLTSLTTQARKPHLKVLS